MRAAAELPPLDDPKRRLVSSPTPPDNAKTFATGLRKVLDSHGHGFHYACLREGQRQFEAGNSNWLFETAEFPVEVRGTGTRIDFVLKHKNAPWYLLAECKRPNPALSRWAFVQAPYVRRDRSSEPYFVEAFNNVSGSPHAFGTKVDHHFDRAFHLGFELRTDQKGEGPSSRNAIEEAASQACRGVSGMVQFFAANLQMVPEGSGVILMPVIFTTAELWTSDVDLSDTDLQSGQLRPEVALESAKWVALQYHMSPGIKHTFRPPSPGRSLGAAMDMEFVRTIPVVSYDGIAQFLNWSSFL